MKGIKPLSLNVKYMNEFIQVEIPLCEDSGINVIAPTMFQINASHINGGHHAE